MKYIGLEHIKKDTGITGYASTDGIKSLKNIFHPGQVLYGKLRPYLNKHDIATFDGVCSTDILVFNSQKTTLPQYINYYFNHRDFIEYIVANSKGINLPRVSEDTVLDALCPLPPLAEQQRIVDRLGSLFAKLDEVKEKVQAVIDGFETRKAAILHKAFTGELTRKWRKSRNIGENTWTTLAIQDICEKITCGKTPKEYIFVEEEIPFLKVYNIVNDAIAFEETPQFIPRHIHESKLKSSILYPNDVVMNIVGPPLRKIAIIPDTYPEWNINQAIVRFRPKEKLNYRFLYYTLINPETLDEVIRATKGVVGQANISVAQSRNLKIKVPSLEEQVEIVRILDSFMSKERQAKEFAEVVIKQIEIIKKVILIRAFRGGLGTSDPSEKSAVELLKEIL